MVKFCRSCGRQLEDHARFCDRCSVAQPSEAAPVAMPKRVKTLGRILVLGALVAGALYALYLVWWQVLALIVVGFIMWGLSRVSNTISPPTFEPVLHPNEVLSSLYEELSKWGTVKKQFRDLNSQLVHGADYHFDAVLSTVDGLDAIFTYGRMPDFEAEMQSRVPLNARCVDVAVGFARFDSQNSLTIDAEKLEAVLREDQAVFSLFSRELVINDGYWDEPIYGYYTVTVGPSQASPNEHEETVGRIIGHTRKVHRKPIPEKYVSARRASPIEGTVTFYKSSVVAFLIRHIAETLSEPNREPISKIEFRCEKCGRQYPDFMEYEHPSLESPLLLTRHRATDPTYCPRCPDANVIKIRPDGPQVLKCPKCGWGLSQETGHLYRCNHCHILVTVGSIEC